MNEQIQENNSTPQLIKTIQSLYNTIVLRRVLQSEAEQNATKYFLLVPAYFLFRTIFQSLLRWPKEGDPGVEPERRTAWVVAGVAGIVKIKKKKIEP